MCILNQVSATQEYFISQISLTLKYFSALTRDLKKYSTLKKWGKPNCCARDAHLGVGTMGGNSRERITTEVRIMIS